MLWVRQLGTSADDAAYGIDVDAAGVVYVAGGTQGNLDGQTNASGGEMGFVVRYDSSGAKVDTNLFCGIICAPHPGPMFQSRLNGIVAAIGGNVFVTGWMNDPAPTTFKNGFFLGQYVTGFLTSFSRIVATSVDFNGTSIVSGPADGGIYVTGFKPLDAAATETYGFVRRVSASDIRDEQYDTLFQTLEPSANEALGVTALAGGDTFVVGRTQQGVDGNTNLGGYDMYIAHLNEAGQIQ